MCIKITLKKSDTMIEKVMKIVKNAAKLMLNHPFEIEQKDGYENIVTSTDIQVQQYLICHLKKLIIGAGFLCEESNMQEVNKTPYCWIIDPIDGTTNFTRHLKQSAISVALKKENEIVLGVVYNPFLDDMFFAVKNEGAFLNKNRIQVSNRQFADGLFCTAMSLYKKDLAPQCFDVIAETYQRCNDIRRFGSCALELCYLASGFCDLYFEMRVFPWDFAAAQLILKEAGGVISTLHRQEVYFDKPILLTAANNAENHKVLSSIVSKHIKQIPFEEEL